MLLISARVVPQAARASWVSSAGVISIPCSPLLALTISINVMLSSPLGPLAFTLRPSIVTVTPLTGGIGFLPVLDIVVFLRSHRLDREFLAHALIRKSETTFRAHVFRRRDRVPRHPGSGILL